MNRRPAGRDAVWAAVTNREGSGHQDHRLPLLAFKLGPPTAPRWLVARPRLFELLDAGAQGPVTVLIGPAGSGKTALLSSWVATAALPGPVAWVSLDAADNDPARFWAYLVPISLPSRSR